MSDVEKLEDYRVDPKSSVTAIKTLLLKLRMMIEQSDLVESDEYQELLNAIDVSRSICNRYELETCNLESEG